VSLFQNAQVFSIGKIKKTPKGREKTQYEETRQTSYKKKDSDKHNENKRKEREWGWAMGGSIRNRETCFRMDLLAEFHMVVVLQGSDQSGWHHHRHVFEVRKVL